MPRKGITQRSVGFEYPTAKAELTILLVDVNGRTEPVRWQSRRSRLTERRADLRQELEGRLAARAVMIATANRLLSLREAQRRSNPAGSPRRASRTSR